MSNCAWVTLTTNDAYSLGALVLANSLKRVGTVHKLVVLVTPTVSEAMRSRLGEVFNLVQEVNVLDSQDTANLALLARPELGITFTKLHAWKLVQFEKCVFLDSDTLVLQNADELFEREELSAAPDVCWPDCFNSGVFVYRPSEATYASITEFALKNGSFDGGDQGLLNSYFSGWAHTDISKHLPFTYNTAAFATYSYLPAFKEFKNKIKILHFAGQMKPWLLNFNSETRTAYVPSHFHHASDLIQLWWNIYCDNVHQILSDKMLQNEKKFNQNLHSSYWPIEESPWSHNQNCNNPDLLYFPVVENYNSGDFFDDIQPYHDPWEDYYKNLENIKEQNFSNQNETFYEYKSPSPPPFHHNEPDHRQDTYSNDATENVPQTPVHDHQYEFHHSPSPQVEEDTFYECVETPQPTEMTFNDNLEQNSTKHEEIASSQWEEAHSDNCQTNDDNDTHRTNSKSDFNQLEHESQKSETKIFDKSPSPESESRDDKDLPVDTQKVLETKPSTSEAGLAGALAQVRLGEPRSSEQEAYEATMRRQCWEQGNIDYTGRDSFDNIWKKITQTLEAKPEPEAPAKPADGSN